jgi:O-antigen/teichoic acid export membrane protein
MSLKQKTVNGLVWSFIDNVAGQGITFIVGILLARLLSPAEFGLIGMVTIFIAISQSIIDSGFTQALIRKTDCSQSDYSTVFFFNLFIGILCYLILYLSAESISSFFKEPQLGPLLQILGTSLVISSLSIVHKAILTRDIDFKLQTRISVIASLVSGIVSLYLAFEGYGVWSLVYMTIIKQAFNTLLLWIWKKWRPTFIFDIISFREMGAFGSRLLVSGLIDTTYRNLYYLVIGRFFSASDLGYFTRADQFASLPAMNLTAGIQRVSYPVLSGIREDTGKLKDSYRKLIKGTMLISFVVMMGISAVAKPMILVLIGEKWSASIVYLQMLCLVSMFYPLHALNLNMLQVEGRSDLFLRLEIIKKIMAIPTIMIGIYFGIKAMIIGMMFNTIVAYYLNSFWSGRFIGYPIIDQIKDILPSFMLALFCSTVVYFAGELIDTSYIVILILQIMIGALITVTVAEFFKMEDYLYIKSIVFDKIKRSGQEDMK